MANFNQYPSKAGDLRQNIDNPNQYSMVRPDGVIDQVDIDKANPNELKYFKVGVAVGEVNYKLEQGILRPANEQVNPAIVNLGNIDADFKQSDGMGQSQSKQKVLTPNAGKPNIHMQPQVIDNTPTNISALNYDSQVSSPMSGFTNKVLIAILSGLGIGIISAAIYIFANLGKFTINI